MQKPAAILGMIEQMAGGLGLNLDDVLRRAGQPRRRAADAAPPLEITEK